jgi:regulator of protease activity HflC (stomatin/prohibitin superfamily)
VLVISVGLFGGSFKTVDPLHAALKKNTVSGDVTREIFTSGRYFLGLTFDFERYPTTLQSINFWDGDQGTLKASTNEGQAITLEISFQYRLMIENLYELYRDYEQGYETNYVSVAGQAIKNMAASEYSTTDFFETREAIQEALHVHLNRELAEHFCVVEHFQILQVTVPSATDETILNKLISEQEVKITEANQEILVIEGETDVLVKQAEADVVVIEASAQNTATKILGEMNSYAASVHLNYTAAAYKDLKDALGYNSDEIMKHMWLEHIRTLPEDSQSTVAVDLPNALFNF